MRESSCSSLTSLMARVREPPAWERVVGGSGPPATMKLRFFGHVPATPSVGSGTMVANESFVDAPTIGTRPLRRAPMGRACAILRVVVVACTGALTPAGARGQATSTPSPSVLRRQDRHDVARRHDATSSTGSRSWRRDGAYLKGRHCWASPAEHEKSMSARPRSFAQSSHCWASSDRTLPLNSSRRAIRHDSVYGRSTPTHWKSSRGKSVRSRWLVARSWFGSHGAGVAAEDRREAPSQHRAAGLDGAVGAECYAWRAGKPGVRHEAFRGRPRPADRTIAIDRPSTCAWYSEQNFSMVRRGWRCPPSLFRRRGAPIC